MTRARMRPLVTKEVRALLPAWFATLCAIGAAALGAPPGHVLGLAAYAFGSIALGAQSIGHEYTCHTLTLLLTQPSSRRRLLLVKFGVLTTMVLMLAAVARLTLLRSEDLEWMYAGILCSLFAAPLLTMLCRNPLAGIVLMGAVPVWATVLSDLVSPAVLWGVTLVICVPAAVASWRVFMRLEAIDGRGSELELPRVFRETPAIAVASPDVARRRHPVWQLVKKELHLQQMTFAVAGLWVVIWAAAFALAPIVPALPEFPLAGVGILYGALLAVLIGSLASAEERQNGTLEWQLLLPMAVWKQWAIKVTTALALTALVSYALPVALAAGRIGVYGWHAAAILMLTTGSLYVSSLCRTAVRALIVSGVVMLALGELGLYVAGAYDGMVAFLAVPLAAVFALMLWFALENHRSADHRAGRVAGQVISMAGCLLLGVAVLTAFR